MIMRDLYESEYRLYDHRHPHPNKPLASIAMHKQEDLNTDSALEQVCRLYIRHRIYECFHLDLLQFLELPADVIEMLIALAKENTKQSNKAMSEVEKSMQLDK